MAQDAHIPQWLEWARRIQALAQTGGHYAPNEFETQRFQQLNDLAAEIVTAHAALPKAEVLQGFSLGVGYATPKVDVRAVVFREGRLLMVREKLDGGWTLPGGWADVGDRPAGAAERETWEEAGYRVKATRLVGVYDANRLGELRFNHAFKLVFLCDLVGGEAATSMETTEVGWFARAEIPQPFAGQRTRWRHIEDAFAMHADPQRATVFD